MPLFLSTCYTILFISFIIHMLLGLNSDKSGKFYFNPISVIEAISSFFLRKPTDQQREKKFIVFDTSYIRKEFTHWVGMVALKQCFRIPDFGNQLKKSGTAGFRFKSKLWNFSHHRRLHYKIWISANLCQLSEAIGHSVAKGKVFKLGNTPEQDKPIKVFP